MKPKLPSPAMVVAIVALLVGLSGTAVAAVNFANNAGAVDGKSAVASGASLTSAAGKLVATQRRGSGKGRIASQVPRPARVDARQRRATSARRRASSTTAARVAQPIGSVPGIGALTATCKDENAAAGRLDPATTITLANTSGEAINLMRKVDSDAAAVIAAAPTASCTSSRSPARGRSRFTSSAAARTRSSTASSARTGATSRRRSAWSTASRS